MTINGYPKKVFCYECKEHVFNLTRQIHPEQRALPDDVTMVDGSPVPWGELIICPACGKYPIGLDNIPLLED